MSCTICSECHRTVLNIIKHRSSCTGGICTDCGKSFLNVKKHKCPIRQITNLPDTIDTKRIESKLITCQDCKESHMLCFGSNKFITWKDKSLCRDCYIGNQSIQDEIREKRIKLYKYMFEINKINKTNTINKTNKINKINKTNTINGQCEYPKCDKQLLTKDGICLKSFIFDHVDVDKKVSTPLQMISTGQPWSDVTEEADKCQLLCYRCNSIESFCEIDSKLIYLKTARVDDDIKRFAKKVSLNKKRKYVDQVHDFLDSHSHSQKKLRKVKK